MLSSKVVKEAIETSHATCQGTEGCIHADAMATNHELMRHDIVEATLGGLAVGGPSFIPESVYNSGFHAGYRAAILQYEESIKKAA